MRKNKDYVQSFWISLNPKIPSEYTALLLLSEAHLWNPEQALLLQIAIEGGWIVTDFDLAATDICKSTFYWFNLSDIYIIR
jgi:hypothetical protein